MRRLLVGITTAFLMAAGGAHAQQAGPAEALDGLDPVLLVQGREVDGKPDLTSERGGLIYRFSSPDTKRTFESDPARYEIQFGGTCARMGRSSGGNPSDFYVHEGRIYVFGSDDCHKAFVANPAKYLPPPVEAMPASADALAAGRALLDRAATALGDAARLDRLGTYAETASQVQARPMGEVTVTTRTLWRFPSEARRERAMKSAARSSENATVLNGTGAWFVMGAQAFPMRDAGREGLLVELGRHPVALLRARRDPGVDVASLGRGTMAGATVERVRVQNGQIDAILGLDPASGRIQALRFVDRSSTGEYGTYTLRYDDFRPVDGLMLPFSVKALFNDQPDPSQSWMVESIALDPAVDPAMFQPPAGGK